MVTIMSSLGQQDYLILRFICQAKEKLEITKIDRINDTILDIPLRKFEVKELIELLEKQLKWL